LTFQDFYLIVHLYPKINDKILDFIL